MGKSSSWGMGYRATRAISIFSFLNLQRCSCSTGDSHALETSPFASSSHPHPHPHDIMKSGVYQFLIGAFAAIGSFLFGYGKDRSWSIL